LHKYVCTFMCLRILTLIWIGATLISARWHCRCGSAKLIETYKMKAPESL
jgi:hypothetical protein